MALVKQDFAAWVVETIRRRGRIVIRSQGRSMQPVIPDGSLVEVRPVAFDELRVGDIVVFHYAGDVFCHRLIRKVGRRLILKGDTLLAADPPVPRDHIIGRVTLLIRDGERLVAMDTTAQRWRAAWRARCTYPYAICFHARRALRRMLEWNRGVFMMEDR